MQVNKTLKIG